MPYITVVLKNGTTIPVPDADTAEWVFERPAIGGTQIANDVRRLKCMRASTVVARFNAEDVAGYTWRDAEYQR